MTGGESGSLLDPFLSFSVEDEICSFPQYIVEDLHASPSSMVRGISSEAGCSLGEVVSPARIPVGGRLFSREMSRRKLSEVGGSQYIYEGINSC